jgi:hypothetical protein
VADQPDLADLDRLVETLEQIGAVRNPGDLAHDLVARQALAGAVESGSREEHLARLRQRLDAGGDVDR